jgi:hypothetical protein
MNQYERLLFEIGEKSYFTSSKQWSPELRLIGIIVLNGAIFVGTKMLFRSTGANLMNIIGQAGSTPPAATSSSSSRPRMRGPDIDLEILGTKKKS